MAAIDVVAIPYESDYVTFDDLRLGASTQRVVGRLLRFWESTNEKKNGEFLGIVFLLLDEKNTVIHGFIPADTTSQFRHQLWEGAIFYIGGFKVAKCTNLHRITDHPFCIRILPTTTLDEIADAAITIKREKFMLRKYDHLHALANTNIELPDVVGQVRFVQGSNLDDAASTQRLVVRLLLDLEVIAYLSLWDEAAANFRAHLSSGRATNSVMVVTTVNPKLFQGNLYLNSTPATRFFFDSKIHAIGQFTKSLGTQATEPFKLAETKDGIHKKELVTIVELKNYISQTNEQAQDADFLCKARVVGILRRNGWSYLSCASCSTKLDKRGTSLWCNRCVTPITTGLPRYRVELAVQDRTGAATFVVFDAEMAKFTKKTAAALTLDEGDGDNDNGLPNCLQNLAGKQFVFQLRVRPFSFPTKNRPFTVATFTEETENEDAAEGEDEHGGNGGPGGNAGLDRSTTMAEKESSRTRVRE